MRGQARRKPPEEGDEGRGLWGKKNRGTGVVETGGCADSGSGSDSGSTGTGISGSETEHADRAEIRDDSQRAPKAPKPP